MLSLLQLCHRSLRRALEGNIPRGLREIYQFLHFGVLFFGQLQVARKEPPDLGISTDEVDVFYGQPLLTLGLRKVQVGFLRDELGRNRLGLGALH